VEVPVYELAKVRTEFLPWIHKIDNVRGCEDTIAAVHEDNHGVSGRILCEVRERVLTRIVASRPYELVGSVVEYQEAQPEAVTIGTD
jgi:hypothetical protein